LSRLPFIVEFPISTREFVWGIKYWSVEERV
jgi:hypothetical protein